MCHDACSFSRGDSAPNNVDKSSSAAAMARVQNKNVAAPVTRARIMA